MTDNEIKKALECCGSPYNRCLDCPLCEMERVKCFTELTANALDLINRQQAEVEKLKDSRDRWKRNALAFDEASRETEKELERLYAEIEEHKNKCDKCGAKTRACIESLQNNIAEKQAEIEELEAEYEKVYEQAEADILGNLPQGGTSCHWCIDKHKKYAIKECLGKIEQIDVSESDDYIVIKRNKFDNLVKEMVGEQ